MNLLERATADNGPVVPDLLSIITPSYNHAGYIAEAIESVLGQDYPHVEHIVVDGGSTDGTLDVLRDYGKRYPTRFRWVSEPDRGQSDALNKGIAMARGEFIGWQNSDDYYLPNVFREPIHYLASHPDVAMVYSDRQRVDEFGNVLMLDSVGPFREEMLIDLDGCIPNQAAFMRRDTILACGGLNVELYHSMDRDLWIRLGLSNRIEYLPGVRGAWRCYPSSKTFTSDLRFWREAPTLIETALEHPLFPVRLRQKAVQTLQRSLIAPLLESIAAQDQETTSAVWEQVLRYDPSLSLWEELCVSAITGSAYVHRPVHPRALLVLANNPQLLSRKRCKQLIASIYVFDLIYAPPPTSLYTSVSLLLRAKSADRWWLRRKEIVARIIEALLGREILELLFHVNRMRRATFGH